LSATFDDFYRCRVFVFDRRFALRLLWNCIHLLFSDDVVWSFIVILEEFDDVDVDDILMIDDYMLITDNKELLLERGGCSLLSYTDTS